MSPRSTETPLPLSLDTHVCFVTEISSHKPPLRAVISISQTLGIADILISSLKSWMFLVIYKMGNLSKYFSFFKTMFLVNSPGWVQTCHLLSLLSAGIVGMCHHAPLLYRFSIYFATNSLSD